MRLRPSGRQGPLATQLSAFQLYQRDEAETWEHMALTRARVVAGDESLAAEVAETVQQTLTRKRDPEKAARDARSMRALIASEKGDKDIWDLKLVAGGLLDIEFVAQYLSIAFGRGRPALLHVSTRTVIERAGVAGLIRIGCGRDADRRPPALHACDAIHAARDLRPIRSGQGGGRREAPHRLGDRLSRFRNLRIGARRSAEAGAQGLYGDRELAAGLSPRSIHSALLRTLQHTVEEARLGRRAAPDAERLDPDREPLPALGEGQNVAGPNRAARLIDRGARAVARQPHAALFDARAARLRVLKKRARHSQTSIRQASSPVKRRPRPQRDAGASGGEPAAERALTAS